MKYTENEADKVLEKLVSSTRSPRGRYSAAESYKLLEKQLSHKNRRIITRRIWGTVASAAAIALICIASWYAYEFLVPSSMQTISTLANRVEVTLPDGSEVMLNHFSSLSYPKRFKGNQRDVALSGEAFFNVTKNPKQPFIVSAEMVKVQVLGTQFNIEAYHNNPEVKTTLIEGSVSVSIDSTTKQIVLHPNESAIYNKNNKTLEFSLNNFTAADIAWQNNAYIFDKQTLNDITRKLSNSFGVNIEIEDEDLASYRLTAKFNNNETLEEILSLLQTGREFTFKKIDDKKIIIIKQLL